LTEEKLNQVPIASSNLDRYLERGSTIERLSLGLQTGREDMTDWLKEWDEKWESATKS